MRRLDGGVALLVALVAGACAPTPVKRGQRAAAEEGGAPTAEEGDAAAGANATDDARGREPAGGGGGGSGALGGRGASGGAAGAGAGGSGGLDASAGGGRGGSGGREDGTDARTAVSEDAGGATGCGDAPPWKPGEYPPGARVTSGTPAHLYECKEFPFDGWCGIVAYEPGKADAPWMDAWTDLGACP
jgi:hypothetical protein